MRKVTYRITKALKLNLLTSHGFAENMYHIDDIELLANSLKEKGLLTKIVVDKNNNIISGRRRAAAAMLLGWEEIDAHIIDEDLTEDETKQLIIAFNQQRKKTFAEFMNEARYVIGTLGLSQGKERVMMGIDGDERFGSIGSDRFALAAQYIGTEMSGTSLRRLFIVDNYEQKNPDAKLGFIEKIGKGTITINKAWEIVVALEKSEKKGKAKTEDLRNTGNYTIITGSSRNMTDDKDDSADLIAGSTAYFQQRDYRDNTALIDSDAEESEPELGQEKTPEEFVENLKPILFEMKRVIKPSGSIMLNVGETYSKGRNNLISQRVIMAACEEVGLHLVNTLIFAKDAALPQTTKRRLQPSYELVLHFVKDSEKYYYKPFEIFNPDKKPKLTSIKRPNKRGGTDKSQPTLSKPYDRFRDFISKQDSADIMKHCGVSPESLELRKLDPSVVHPAPYSSCLMLLPMLCTTKPGDLVIDPFGGTGSTLVTAILMGRNGKMYEKQERFANLAAMRMKELTDKVNLEMAAEIENNIPQSKRQDITHLAQKTKRTKKAA